MAILVEVGLSRKVARNFQSDGVSVNLRAEMDQSLLGKEREFLQEIAALYAKAQAALDRKLGAEVTPNADPPVAAPAQERRATASQLRALRSIAQRIGVNLEDVTQAEATRTPDQLSLAEASKIIDLMKQRQSEQHQESGAAKGRSSR